MKKLLSILFVASLVLVGCGKSKEEQLIEKIEEKITDLYYDDGSFSFSYDDSDFFAAAFDGDEVNSTLYNHPDFEYDTFELNYNFFDNYTYFSDENYETIDYLCRVDVETFKTHDFSDVDCENVEIEAAKRIKGNYDDVLKELDITTEDLLHYMQLKLDEGKAK